MKIKYFFLILFLISVCSLKAQIEIPDLIPIELGAQLENPYEVSNMQLAYNNLKLQAIANNEVFPELVISTTHYYVRFLPTDQLELFLLEEQTGLELFDHPLDYEILNEGHYYRDPMIASESPTWQYAVVEKNFQISDTLVDINMEILSNLYLPLEIDDSTSTLKIGNPDDEAFWEQIENEAHLLTNNEISTLKAGKYNPSGTLLVRNQTSQIPGAIERVVDGQIRNYDGVSYVKGRVRRWFKVRTAYTDENGNFTISAKFRGNVNFGIVYKNDYATMSAGFADPNNIIFGAAFLNGPKGRHWEYRSEQGSASFKWGAIMKALYDYHTIYGPHFNIGVPPVGLHIAAYQLPFVRAFAPMFKKQISVGRFDATQWDVPPGRLNLGMLCDIYMNGKDKDGNHVDYEKLYNTAIHELSHAAHWKLSRNWLSVLTNRDNRMATEAWADGVEGEVSIIKFGTSTVGTWCYPLHELIDIKYPTVIVRDLQDLFTIGCEYLGVDEIIDNVEGYSMNEIFYSLSNPVFESGLGVWRDNLISKHPEKAEETTQYFAQWMGYDYVPCSAPPITLNQDYTNEVVKEVIHTTSIILSDGFKFKALNNDYRFSATIDCPFATASVPVTQTSSYKSSTNNESGKESNKNFVRVPNTSIVFDKPGDTQSLSVHQELNEQTNLKNELSNMELKVFPNPNNGNFDISINLKENQEKLDITFIDLNGKIIFRESNEGSGFTKLNISKSDLPKGVYLLKITIGTASINKRIIIE